MSDKQHALLLQVLKSSQPVLHPIFTVYALIVLSNFDISVPACCNHNNTNVRGFSATMHIGNPPFL